MTIWCNDCQNRYIEACQKHRIISIKDREILTRSRASLPSCLKIKEINENCIGVFSGKLIENRTCFGPYVANRSLEFPTLTNISLFVIINDDNTFEYLDTSNDNECNWMKHVRLCDKPEKQNLLAYQQHENIYFITTKRIKFNEELMVWFSPPYFEQLIHFTKINKHVLLYDEYHQLKRQYTVSFDLSINNGSELKLSDNKYNLFWKKRKILIESAKKGNVTNNDENEFYSSLSPNISADVSKNSPSLEEATLKKFQTINRCNNKFNKLGAFTNIKEKKLSREKLNCNKCWKKFDSIEKLRKHYLYHIADHKKPFNCKICDKSFISKTALISHTRMHKLVKNYICKLCSKQFPHMSNFRIHSNEHFSSETSRYKCTKCEKNFRTFRLASLHYQFSHSPKTFRCTVCDLTFATHCLLEKHNLSHSASSIYLCEICSQQFKRADKLKDHFKRLHLSGKYDPLFQRKKQSEKVLSEENKGTYKCEQCEKMFIRRGMLVNHVHRTHPDISVSQISQLNKPITMIVRDFFCQYCKKVYKSNNKRKEHILKKHPGSELPTQLRPIYCRDNRPMYTAETGQVEKLAQACSHCHRQYSTKAKLLQHIRFRHKEMNTNKPVVKFVNGFTSNKSSSSHMFIDSNENLPSTISNINLINQLILNTTQLPSTLPISPSSLTNLNSKKNISI